MKAITLYAIILSFLVVSLYPTQASGYASEEIPCFTYFEQVGDNKYESKCITWDKTKLTYHISNELDPKYADYYRYAFGVWQYYLDGLITFAEVKSSHSADIKIKIIGELEMCPGALACTELQNDKNGTFTDVYLYASNKQCWYGKFSACINTPDRKFWLAAQHETGHTIGLAHVQDNLIEPIDIMYYKVENGLTIISKDDTQKIRQMYEKPHMVEMKNTPYNTFEDAVQFVPDRITIKQGETVTWINKDDTGKDRNLHTVTSGTPTSAWGTDFDSGNKAMSQGDSFSFTFNEKGEYNYLCAIHPWMLGKVTVT